MRPLLCLLALTSATLAADWPSWRGPSGLGNSADPAAPTQWNKTENVRWHVALPESANSTPVVFGNRIFLTQPLKQQNRVTLMCFDRASGKLLWQAGIENTKAGPTHADNFFASSSPVTDGKLVIAWFGGPGLVAWDINGKELWRRDLGEQKHTWGYASSPVIAGDRVFLNFGPGDRSFLIALDKSSGKTLWQANVPAGTGAPYAAWSAADMYGSWSTPILIKSGTRDELVISWPRHIAAFDPATGKPLWTAGGLGDLIYPSPVYGEGIVVAMAGFGGASAAAKAGGNGDVTATHRVWQTPKSKQQIGSGVITGGHLYTVDNNGIAECTELATGKSIWTNRLRGAAATGTVWSSPVLNEGRIYVMNRSAEVFVFKAAPAFELLSTNTLGPDQESNSSVVISEGDIFLRTFSGLWCIGGPRR